MRLLKNSKFFRRSSKPSLFISLIPRKLVIVKTMFSQLPKTQEECSSKYDLQTHINLFHNGVEEEADVPKGLSCPDCVQNYFYRIVCYNVIYSMIFIGQK